MNKTENVASDSTKPIKKKSRKPIRTDIIRTNNELSRICPNCHQETWHKSAKSRYNSEWANAPCISCKNSGQNNPFYGKHHTEEHKQSIRNRIVSTDTRHKISIGNKGKIVSEYQKDLARLNAVNQFNGPSGNVNRQRIAEIQCARFNGPDGDSIKQSIRQKTLSYYSRKKQTPAYQSWLQKQPAYKLYRMEVDRITKNNDLRVLPNYSKKNLYHKYEVDHIFPIRRAFDYNIPAELIGHIDNLRIIPRRENRSKNGKIIPALIPLHIQQFLERTHNG